MRKTPANPGGLPIDVFDQIRAGVLADRSQFFKDLSGPFFGANRPGAIADSALLSSKIVKNSILKIYKGAPHGLPSTLKDQLNADLLAFIRA
jgi:hypothetical protein